MIVFGTIEPEKYVDVRMLKFEKKIETDGCVIVPTPTKFYPDATLAFICPEFVLFKLNPKKHPGDCECPKEFEYELVSPVRGKEDLSPTKAIPKSLFKATP